jgi:hypothetical protein
MIDTDLLIRWSGLTLVLAGALFGLFPFLHPNHDPGGFESFLWVPAHLMPNVGAIVALLGLTGVFARQLRAAGWLGVVAFVASIIGTASFVGGLMIEAFIIPYMSLEFPELILDDTPPPGVAEAFLVIRMLFMIGFILLGASVTYAGHYGRDLGALLIISAIFNTLGDLLIGDPAFYLGSAMFGFALGWLGWAMWKDQSGRPGVSRLRARPASGAVDTSEPTAASGSAPTRGAAPATGSVSSGSAPTSGSAPSSGSIPASVAAPDNGQTPASDSRTASDVTSTGSSASAGDSASKSG